MAGYARDPGFAQRRAVAFFVIVAFHILLIYGIATGLVPEIIQQITAPLETTIIDEQKLPDELPPPPPPPPEMERPPVQVVASEIQISISADLPPPPITIVTDKPQPPPPPPRPREPDTAIVATFPNPESMYPSAAKSADQEGRPVVSYCVDQNSKLTSAELVDTSGFPLLDEAAVRVVKGGKFKAATADRKPMASCKRVAIKFELKKSN